MEDDIQEMDDLKTEVSQKDDAGAAKADELPASEGSSPSTDVSKPEGEDGLLGIVRDVVAKRPDAKPAASSASDEATGQPTGDRPKEPDNENYSDVPFNKHPRFQQVLGRLKASEQDATRYRNVQDFLDQNGLGAEEAAELLSIGGLMKTNPAEAWRRMKPTVQKLLEAAGEILPDDLKQRVQAGDMNRDAALEVSRLRAADKAHGAQASFREQRDEAKQRQDQAEAVSNAAVDWENDRREKDPNFEAKLPALMREVAFLQSTEGRPGNPEGVRAQLKKAYDAVSASYRPPQATPPQPRAISPVRGGAVAGDPKPAPKNTLDIVNSVVARRHAG